MLVGFFLKMSLCHKLSFSLFVHRSQKFYRIKSNNWLYWIQMQKRRVIQKYSTHAFLDLIFTRSRKFIRVTRTCDRKSHVTGWLHSIRIGCDCLTPDRQAGDLPLLLQQQQRWFNASALDSFLDSRLSSWGLQFLSEELREELVCFRSRSSSPLHSFHRGRCLL